MKLLLGWRSQ